MKQLTFLLFVFLFHTAVFSNTFTVTNTGDSGTGSLREAITYACYTPGTSHTINFNIPVSDGGYNSSTGVWKIGLHSALPYITKANITIDGTSQTVSQGNTNPLGPEIWIDGAGYSVDFAFDIINVSGITIKGFCITNCTLGIQIYGTNATQNVITGNYIGVGPTASDTLGNDIGIEMIGNTNNNIIGGNTPELRNIVSGNSHIGIRVVDANTNFIKGNYVGIDRTGTVAMPNYDGISIEGNSKYNVVGGYNSGEGNLVSGNVAYGIPIFGAGADENVVIGNLVGTDYTGTVGIPNTYGLLFDDGAKNNMVGGSQAGAQNVFSGNSGYGIFLYNMGTNSNIVRGNLIGTDPTGTQAVPNGTGIVVDGAAFSHVIDSNIISGNLQQGIAIHITGSDSTIITRNYIGTDITGDNPLPNGSDGIRIAEGVKNTRIGGSPAEANIIAYNHGNGVTIGTASDLYNRISCNSFHHNDGIGIDLFPPGITPNDAGDLDSGPNDLLNYPEINFACDLGADGHINTINPQNCIIEFYRSDSNNDGNGEGMMYINSIQPNASGTFVSHWMIFSGDSICALTIDEFGNTSEFSENIYVDICESVESISPKQSFEISPNVVDKNDNFEIKYDLPENSATKYVVISNISGKNVFEEAIIGKSGNINISASQFQSGLYFVSVNTEKGKKNVKKLIVQ